MCEGQYVFLLLINILAVWLTVAYGSFLGFSFNHLWVALFTALTFGLSVISLKFDLFKPLINYKFAVLAFASIVPRTYFLLNENPVVPEEFTILVKVMPLNPVLKLPWFIQNYQKILGAMHVHPPVSFIFANLGYLIAPSLVGLRLFPFIFSALSVLVVYLIAREFSEKIAYLTALFYSFDPLVVMFTIVGYTDGYLLFFGLTGLLFFISAVKKRSGSNAFISGILTGLSLLCKSTIGYIWIFLILILGVLFSSISDKLRILLITLLSIITAFLTIIPWACLYPQSFAGAYGNALIFLLH
ncbi:MAG: glycosyltransferase family 39 protein, partial [Candidatus Bathyarchaeia archaeon]